MNNEFRFWLKVLRNGVILSGMFFASTWATETLSWALIKPIIIFFLGYFFTELGRHYRLSPSTKDMNKRAHTTFVF